MSDFFVRINDLSDYSTAFTKLARDAGTSVGDLMSGLGEFADAWGDDAPGKAFFAGYGEPATETLLFTAQMPVQLMALSVAMSATASNYVGTEATNTDLGGGATTA